MAVSANDKIVRGGDLATIGAQIKAKLAEKVSSENIDNMLYLTSAEYDAIATKDPNTIYVVTDGGAELYPQDGKSAYQIWLDNGNVGSEADFLASLKGDTGVSADYPITIYNGLDSTATDAALAAVQGKLLNEQITQLGQDVELELHGYATVQKQYIWSSGYVDRNGKIITSHASKFCQPVLFKAGEKLTYKTGSDYSSAVVSVADNTPVSVGSQGFVVDILIYADRPNIEYTYTFVEDTYAVISVLWSDYLLDVSVSKDDSIDKKIEKLGQEFIATRNIYKIAGAGVTYASVPIQLIKGRKYRIVFDNPSWARNDTGTDSSQYIIGIGSMAGGVSTTIFGVKRIEDTGTLKKSYEFDVPADSEILAIGGRANVGTDIVFSLEDITEITEDITEITEEIGGTLKNFTFEITRPKGYVAYSQGARTHYNDDDNWYVGGLIPVAAGDRVLINVASDINTGSSQKLGAYDSNGNFVDYFSIQNNRTITISDDSIAYVALSTRIVDAPLFKLTVNDVLRYQGSSVVNLSVPELYKQVEQIEEKIGTDDIYNRNADKLPLLFASSNKNLRLQFLIATDSHEGWGALQNAVDFANKCEYIQALFVLGDCTGQAAPSLSTFEQYNQIINTCTKPVFCIAGNHDCGYDKRLRNTALEDKICEYIIEPTYQHLVVGEYTQGKAYYYHDFTDKKVRAIFLYEYDEPISIVENAYWEAVAFDSTKPQYAIGVQYAINDIVNFGLYTANSFRCIQAHTSSAENEIKLNEYRGYRFIGQTQMAWLVSTMLSAPSDYNIIICTHIPASSGYSNTLFRTSKFCTKFLNDVDVFNGMADDYLGILAEAYNNGASGTIKVSGKGTFAYLNVLEDAGVHYAYEISYDFSGKDSGAKFVCFFSGHTHVDCVFKNGRNQFCITPTFTTATTRQFNTNDVPRNPDPKELAYDALTAVALDTINNCVVLTRIGTTGTTDGYLRDVDRIDINP